MDLNAKVFELDRELPEYPAFVPGIRRAPRRESKLSDHDRELAIANALRYIPQEHHRAMAKEFAQELEEHGRIYGYRFRPAGAIHGKPIDEYKSNCTEGKAFQVMIDNNLDFDVALYPYELVTYGETGQVCQNWMQYRLIKKVPGGPDRPADPGGHVRPPSGSVPVPQNGPPRDHHQRPYGGRI